MSSRHEQQPKLENGPIKIVWTYVQRFRTIFNSLTFAGYSIRILLVFWTERPPKVRNSFFRFVLFPMDILNIQKNIRIFWTVHPALTTVTPAGTALPEFFGAPLQQTHKHTSHAYQLDDCSWFGAFQGSWNHSGRAAGEELARLLRTRAHKSLPSRIASRAILVYDC